MNRHLCLRALAAFALAVTAVPLAAQTADYPNKPIRIVVGYSPGGANDILARLLAQKMAETFGQQVVVENRPSTAAIIGTEAVAKAAPDGYTLLMGASGPIVFNPALYSKLPYSPTRDLAPVSMVGSFPLILVVQGQGPLRTLKDLIDHTKQQPSKSNYGSSAASFQLATELLKSKTGIVAEHIPYKGSADSVNAVVAGQVLMTLVDSGPATGPIKGGLLRALAVTSGKRMPQLPEVPTMTEQGIDLQITLWSGLLAPAGTPPPIVKKLQTEVARIVKLPDVRERMTQLGIEPEGGTPEEFARVIASEIPQWTAVARDNQIKAD
ncbi:MAG TPA: tripartite tricarboxylate transporter substrate binding protein [Burkholderiaceae bacterium]|nr:tripartite tricarboxylate transporter substrate binding protein [Burkholderiaceae bacterium]